MTYNNEPFYIKTPIAESSSILEKNGDSFLYINFYETKVHSKFINTLRDINMVTGTLNNSVVMTTKHKMTLKINILTTENTFFNKSGNDIIPFEIQDLSKCVCLIYYDKNQFSLYQYMKL